VIAAAKRDTGAPQDIVRRSPSLSPPLPPNPFHRSGASDRPPSRRRAPGGGSSAGGARPPPRSPRTIHRQSPTAGRYPPTNTARAGAEEDKRPRPWGVPPLPPRRPPPGKRGLWRRSLLGTTIRHPGRGTRSWAWAGFTRRISIRRARWRWWARTADSPHPLGPRRWQRPSGPWSYRRGKLVWVGHRRPHSVL
jgi:hypothetical protein